MAQPISSPVAEICILAKATHDTQGVLVISVHASWWVIVSFMSLFTGRLFCSILLSWDFSK